MGLLHGRRWREIRASPKPPSCIGSYRKKMKEKEEEKIARGKGVSTPCY